MNIPKVLISNQSDGLKCWHNENDKQKNHTKNVSFIDNFPVIT